MRTVFFRLDDACHTMAWPVWNALEEVFDEFGIKPIVAVIPDCDDPKMQYAERNEAFWDWVRAVQVKGWIIGMHGFQHKYVTKDHGMIPINAQSEFAGLPYDEQKAKIEASLRIFQEQRVDPVIWVAPSHSFDRITLAALRDVTSIRMVSDGISFYPYTEEGFVWIPQQQWRARKIGFGVETVCLHPNWMTVDAVRSLAPFLRSSSVNFRSDLDKVVKQYGMRQRTWADRLYWRYFFLRKSVLDHLYGS